MLLVTSGGKILFLEFTAERLIRNSDGLTVENGVLGAMIPGETRPLRTLVAGAAKASSTRADRMGHSLWISRPSGHTPLELLISPLLCLEENWIRNKQQLVAVFVADRGRGAAEPNADLKTLHGLTAKETTVALAISRGLVGKEICRELKISYNTLKTHLKHIHTKTHTKRQVELFRLLTARPRMTEAGNQEAEG